MSRIRRISYAITPEGRRANVIKQAIDLRDKVLSVVDNANFSTSTARKITKKAAFSVVMRSLEESKGLPLSLREHLAMKELNKYISLAKHNKSDFFYATNTDLLPISHPRSTREHSMTASALRIARSRWFAADPRITDERAKAILASAFESIPGSVEHLYYTSILLSLPQGMIPGEALIAASDGNSFESRSARARRQRRDRKGRFAYEGGGIRALIRRIDGNVFSLSGRVVANAKNSKDVEVEFPNGKIAEINPAKGEYIKAVLPTPDGYSPEPIIPSVTDEVINEKDLVFLDAPNGWEKDEKYKEFGDKVERYVDSNKEFVVFVSKQDDGTKDYQILNAKSAEQIAVVKTWADVQDKLEGNEDKLLNPKANLPFRQGLIPAEDRPGPNAYERLMAEKKDKENAIANRKAELKKNADDRVDALDRTVPEGWAIEEKNNALMLRRATEPADLENIYKQDNFVARVVEQGEISVKDKNNLLEDKVYQNWAYVDKDKDARATEYAQKAREEIKKFAAPYGYKEEDLNKIDAMSADEIASFFLDERLQPEGFADALDDYMNSAMVDAPSQQQQAKWKSFGEKLKVINDAGDFPGNNKKKADLPKQPDAPVETKGGFEFNYPAGAYKIKQGSAYDPQGRVDEDSPDFTDDPIELAQKQDERDILAALEQAVSPGENGENALGVGALPFAKGDEYVPAEALFFALEEAGIDAPMELAKIYDKKLGADNNEKALNDFRKKAEIVSGNTPELAESFKKVTEQNPDLEAPTKEPKFDAKEMDLIPLPPLLEGLSQKELDQFNETKDHIPYLPKNEEIQMPEGYNPLSPEPFAAWKEVTADNPDPILPEGFSDNPVFLAQEISTNDLLKELRRSVEPGNEVPGAAVIALPTDDEEDFVANVPGEAVRDALQLKGIDTNAELKKIAEEGLIGQIDEDLAVEIPADDVVRLVVDGDVPLETQIRDAIAAKKKIAFLYNDTERLVLPVEIFENPRNSNINVRAIDAKGDKRTFTLSKIENSKEGAPAGAPEITDKEIFDRRMAGESLQDLADALGIPREEVRAREAKYLRENPQESPLNEEQMKELENILGSDNFGVKDGYLFLRKEEGFGKYADEVSVYDYKKYDEEVANNKELATINNDGNIDWPTEEDFNNHSANINNILNVEKADEKNLVGDYKPTADQIDKLQKGVAEMDWLDDGIMFLKPDEGGPRAEAPIEIYDDNGLPEDGPFAKIDVDGNFEWKDQGAYDKYADRLKEILDADLVGIGDNQNNQEPQEIDNVPVEQAKLDDNQEPKDKTYVEENPEVIKVNAFVEANAGRLAPTKARDVKTGDFLWNNFNKVYEEILDIQPAPFGRVRFLIKDPRNQKEYFRFFDRRSPIRNMRRLGTGEVPEDFRVPSEENKGDGPKRGRALRQPLEKRVEVVAGRDVGGFAYREGFYKDKNGIVLKPGDRVRHGNAKKNEMYGEGVVIVRAGDQIDEAKKVGGIGRNGKVYKDYVWVQIPGEDGPRLWKSRMIVKQGNSTGPARVAPEAKDVAPEAPKVEVPKAEPITEKIPDAADMNEELVQKELKKVRVKYFPKARDYAANDEVRGAGKKLDEVVNKLNAGEKIEDLSISPLDSAIRKLRRVRDLENNPNALVLADYIENFKKEIVKYKEEKDKEKRAEYERILNEPIPDDLIPANVDALDEEKIKEAVKIISIKLPKWNERGANRKATEAAYYLERFAKEMDQGQVIEGIDPTDLLQVSTYLKDSGDARYESLGDKIDQLNELIKQKQIANEKPFAKANMEFIDPVAEAEKRVNNKDNEFNASSKLRSAFASDEIYQQNSYLDPHKDQLKEFFALEGGASLAKLDQKARQALAQYASQEIRNPDGMQGADEAETAKNINEIATLVKALHDEKMVYSPNRSNIGPADALLNIDPTKILNFGKTLDSGVRKKLVIDGNDTGFDIQRVSQGINSGSNFRLIHRQSGQVVYFKREKTEGAADAEYVSSKIAQSLGIAGAAYVQKHPNDARTVIITNAGDGIDFKNKPVLFDNFPGKSSTETVAKRASLADVVGLAVLDAVIYNTDRHVQNFLAGVVDNKGVEKNGYEEIQLLPIDHGFAQLLNGGGSRSITDPFTHMKGRDARSGGEINRAVAKQIGATAYKELIDMTSQQAIQALKRMYGSDISKATLDEVISRLEALRGISKEKWRTGLAGRD
jgi:hypothetical protein